VRIFDSPANRDREVVLIIARGGAVEPLRAVCRRLGSIPYGELQKIAQASIVWVFEA